VDCLNVCVRGSRSVMYASNGSWSLTFLAMSSSLLGLNEWSINRHDPELLLHDRFGLCWKFQAVNICYLSTISE
jgi:hypothetical protein